jgi:hypothetical protein
VEQGEAVVVETSESVSKNKPHWSRSSIAQNLGLSTSTIGGIRKAFALKPHRADKFTLSTDRGETV